MHRRRFLTSGVRLLGGSLLLPAARVLGADSLSVVSASGADGAAQSAALPDLVLAKGEARSATLQALEAIGGMKRFVKAGQVVAIKPNASFASPPDWGATTHPDVLAAVVESCLEAEARRVLVVDHTMPGQKRCFERNGTADALATLERTKLVSLDDEKSYEQVQVPAGRAVHETKIAAAIQRADVFINLPTAKAHAATEVSLGFKNLMGLIWDRQSFHRDMDLHVAIADLGTVLRPELTVLDAMRILKTGGPTGPGDVDALGGVIVGVDPVAVDAFGVGLSTWNGRTYRADGIAHIRHAADHGLGSLKLEALRVVELG
jgi:uncharacterized protein (DUF362 family)